MSTAVGGQTSHAAGRTLLLVATYNERENLPALVERVFAVADLDLLIVDDTSPDGTGELADSMAAADPRITVVHREGKQGVATAHVLAFRHALANGYARIVEMDADLSHPPEDLPRLLAASQGADVVVGSRSVAGGQVVGRSRLRNLLTAAGCLYARAVLRLPVRDCTGGFRCSTRAALTVIDLGSIRSHGYGFQLELNLAWSLAGMRFAEVPIVFRDRTAGRSKMTTRILVESLAVVMRLRLGLVRPALRHAALLHANADQHPA